MRHTVINVPGALRRHLPPGHSPGNQRRPACARTRSLRRTPLALCLAPLLDRARGGSLPAATAGARHHGPRSADRDRAWLHGVLRRQDARPRRTPTPRSASMPAAHAPASTAPGTAAVPSSARSPAPRSTTAATSASSWSPATSRRATTPTPAWPTAPRPLTGTPPPTPPVPQDRQRHQGEGAPQGRRPQPLGQQVLQRRRPHRHRHLLRGELGRQRDHPRRGAELGRHRRDQRLPRLHREELARDRTPACPYIKWLRAR